MYIFVLFLFCSVVSRDVLVLSGHIDCQCVRGRTVHELVHGPAHDPRVPGGGGQLRHHQQPAVHVQMGNRLLERMEPVQGKDHVVGWY